MTVDNNVDRKADHTSVDKFIAQEFARETATHHYVLGVVHDDSNGNRRYNQGAVTPGVTVRTTDGAFSTIKKTAGGFGMRIDTPGTYTLEASGGNAWP